MSFLFYTVPTGTAGYKKPKMLAVALCLCKPYFLYETLNLTFLQQNKKILEQKNNFVTTDFIFGFLCDFFCVITLSMRFQKKIILAKNWFDGKQLKGPK